MQKVSAVAVAVFIFVLTVLGVVHSAQKGDKKNGNSDETIKSFCSLTYGVSFPMFSKISVAGKDVHPFYRLLTTVNPDFSGKITWNFNKFILDRKGQVVGRFDSKEKPDSIKVVKLIESLLEKEDK